ncbi:hypothetical protein [Carboxylicivirga marina]|uniref:hypothetical protein n=1 Tax=Carboxylicivirga marina TaxID=2800988 RepID=UPI002591C948|nr:hypothetical protein [uncultured Carboxylicivirga sp.]
MPALKKHIAILLFGTFFFPLAYQSWHLIKEHSPVSHCDSGCCHSKKSEKTYNIKPGINDGSEKEETCPICEFHFSLNILPTAQNTHSKNKLSESSNTELTACLYLEQVNSEKSPRAPPAQS